MIPQIASGAESMAMAQVGISGSITTPGMLLSDLTGGGKEHVLVGTSTGLFVLTGDGQLHRFIQTSSAVTNVAVIGDITGDGVKEVAISTSDFYFPNVYCYDIESKTSLWSFSPKTEVYDPYILWTMKQTRVFDMTAVGDINSNGYDDIVLSSGYFIYALDGKTGESVWVYEDTDNVWDLLAVDDQDGDGLRDILAGDQNGYLYLINGLTGKEIWKKDLAHLYTVIDPSTNSPSGSVKRSVWDIVPLQVDGRLHAAVSAEDGFVHLIRVADGETAWKQEVIEYVDTLLYNYYGNSPIPTGIADYNFFNLRIAAIDDATGDGNGDIIASAFPGYRTGKEYKGERGLYMLDSGSGEKKWVNENMVLSYMDRPGIIELEKPYVAVHIGISGGKGKVRLIDPATGSTHGTLTLNSSAASGRSNIYHFASQSKDRFFMVSSFGDLSLIEYPSKVAWSYLRINSISITNDELTGDSASDMLVRSRSGDNENPFTMGQSRIVFVIDGSTREVAWSYTMPHDAFSETGGLYAVQVAPDITRDGKSEVIAYVQYPGDWDKGDMYGEKTRVLIFSGSDGRVIMNKSVTDSMYYGIYDGLLRDKIMLNQTVREMLLKQMGLEESHIQKMDLDAREQFYRQYEEKVQEILRREREVRIKKRIESLDVINDYSGDGVPDFIIGCWNDVFIMDSISGKIIWNRTMNTNNYENPFTHEQPAELFQNWTGNDRSRFLSVGDANDDGMDDLIVVDYDRISFLHSNMTRAGLDYSMAAQYVAERGIDKEKVSVIDDLNGNGVKDIVFEAYVEDAPSMYTFADGRNGFIIMEAERGGTSAALGIDDFDGNGFKDTIIFQSWSDSGEPKLEIVDGRTRDTVWSYSGIDETWMLRDIYGYTNIMPAAPAGDFDGDGITDIAVGRSQAWSPGAEVLIYSSRGNELLAKVTVEDIDETRGDTRWIPAINAELIADMNGDGRRELGVIMAVGEEYEKRIKMFVVDIANLEVISDFTSIGSEIINLGGTTVGMVGSSGNIFFLDTSKDMSITSPASGSVTGSPISVEWETGAGAMSMLMVDDKRTLITDGDEAEFEILSGEHKITIYAFDRFGKGLYDSVTVTVEKGSASFALVAGIVLVLLAFLFMPKLLGMISRVKR
ncbi:MAG: PQQ-binding-like beta-propeller repeat protein [Candidatus Aenigmarchaeota archaeon]|nr:PQQ-binding-like beta-propeller repeat protein [Candidatus Aenigmarchaeota archaeon]